MVKTAIELTKEINNLKNGYMALVGGEGGLEHLNYEQYQTLQSSLKMLDLSSKLMLEYAEMMDRIDSKLDKLISQNERES